MAVTEVDHCIRHKPVTFLIPLATMPPKKKSKKVMKVPEDVYIWGRGKHGQLGHGDERNQFSPRPIDLSVFRAVQGLNSMACGFNFNCAVTPKGELFTWGYGAHGQLGHGMYWQARLGGLVVS